MHLETRAGNLWQVVHVNPDRHVQETAATSLSLFGVVIPQKARRARR